MMKGTENSTEFFLFDHGLGFQLNSQLIYPVLTGLRKTPGGC